MNLESFRIRLGMTEQHPVDCRIDRGLSRVEVHTEPLLEAPPDLALGDRIQIRVTKEFLDSSFKFGIRRSIPDIHVFRCPRPGKVHAEIIRSASLLLGMVAAALAITRHIVPHLIPWTRVVSR
jgi:hypothetical protein